MTEDIQKVAVLLAFALVMFLINLKAGSTWFKFVTFIGLIATLCGAGWFTWQVISA